MSRISAKDFKSTTQRYKRKPVETFGEIQSKPSADESSVPVGNRQYGRRVTGPTTTNGKDVIEHLSKDGPTKTNRKKYKRRPPPPPYEQRFTANKQNKPDSFDDFLTGLTSVRVPLAALALNSANSTANSNVAEDTFDKITAKDKSKACAQRRPCYKGPVTDDGSSQSDVTSLESACPLYMSMGQTAGVWPSNSSSDMFSSRSFKSPNINENLTTSHKVCSKSSKTGHKKRGETKKAVVPRQRAESVVSISDDSKTLGLPHTSAFKTPVQVDIRNRRRRLRESAHSNASVTPSSLVFTNARLTGKLATRKTRRRMTAQNRAASRRYTKKILVKFKKSGQNSLNVISVDSDDEVANIDVVDNSGVLEVVYASSDCDAKKNSLVDNIVTDMTKMKVEENLPLSDEILPQDKNNISPVKTPTVFHVTAAGIGSMHPHYSLLRKRLTSTPHRHLSSKARLPTTSTPVTGDLSKRIDKLSPVGGDDDAFELPSINCADLVGQLSFSKCLNTDNTGGSIEYENCRFLQYKPPPHSGNNDEKIPALSDCGPTAIKGGNSSFTDNLRIVKPCSVVLVDCYGKSNTDSLLQMSKSELSFNINTTASTSNSEVQELSIMMKVSNLGRNKYLTPKLKLTDCGNNSKSVTNGCTFPANNPTFSEHQNSQRFDSFQSSFFAEVMRCAIAPSPVTTRSVYRRSKLSRYNAVYESNTVPDSVLKRRRRARVITSLLPAVTDPPSNTSSRTLDSNCTNADYALNSLRIIHEVNPSDCSHRSRSCNCSRQRLDYTTTRRMLTRSQASRSSRQDKSDKNWADLDEHQTSNNLSVKYANYVDETSIQSDNSVDETSIQSDDHVDETSIQSDDHVNETSIQSDDYVDENSIQSDDHVNETSIQSDDHVNETSIQSDDYVNETSIQSDDHANETSIESDDHVNETSIQSDDHVNETSIQSDDHVNETSIQSDDHGDTSMKSYNSHDKISIIYEPTEEKVNSCATFALKLEHTTEPANCFASLVETRGKNTASTETITTPNPSFSTTIYGTHFTPPRPSKVTMSSPSQAAAAPPSPSDGSLPSCSRAGLPSPYPPRDGVVPTRAGKGWRRSLSLAVNASNVSMSLVGEQQQQQQQPVLSTHNFGRRQTAPALAIPSRRLQSINESSFSWQRRTSILQRTPTRLSYASQQPSRGVKGRYIHVTQPDRAEWIGDESTAVLLKEEQTVEMGSAHDEVLKLCSQDEILPLEDCFPDSESGDCKKIGEGVYGEVFVTRDARGQTKVLKVMPIEGSQEVNGEPQKTFEEIISEIVISMSLSQLRDGESDMCRNFVHVVRCWCVRGAYTSNMLHHWDLFNTNKGSENDRPDFFTGDQVYIVLEFGHAGQDLESFVFNNASQALAVFQQVACGLSVSERSLEFEHRDLHWGNVLVATTADKLLPYRMGGAQHELLTKGVHATIIDFTLSRVRCSDDHIVFNDLASDPSLFTATGDYQFDIYRAMRETNGDEWEPFEPRTNVLWLHYLLDKLISECYYKNVNTKVHKTHLAKLREMYDQLLEYNSAQHFVESILV